MVGKANVYMKVKLRHFDTKLGILSSSTCYKTVVADRIYFIILILTEEMNLDDELRRATTSLHQRALKNLSKGRLKRYAVEIDTD